MMPEDAVSPRDAKARLSQLAERATAGAGVVIAKHGRATARLAAARRAREPINLGALRAPVRAMPRQNEGPRAATAVQRVPLLKGMAYLDTGSAVATLTREAQTAAVQAWLAPQAPETPAAGEWTLTEFPRRAQ